MSEIVYTCAVCGKKNRAEKGKPVPLCCRREMEPLPFCTSASNSEMSRSEDPGEPCDDGTLGKKK